MVHDDDGMAVPTIYVDGKPFHPDATGFIKNVYYSDGSHQPERRRKNESLREFERRLQKKSDERSAAMQVRSAGEPGQIPAGSALRLHGAAMSHVCLLTCCAGLAETERGLLVATEQETISRGQARPTVDLVAATCGTHAATVRTSILQSGQRGGER